MTTVLLLAGPSAEGSALSALDTPGITVRRCLDAVDLLARIQSEGGEVVIVDGPRSDIDADTVEQLESHRMGSIALVTSPAGRAWASALGISDIVDLANVATLPDRVREIGARERANADAGSVPADPGRLIAVWGPVGSPGRSTVAVNLAAELARREDQRVLLVDADTYGASIAQQLGLLDDVSGILAASRAANHGRDLDPGPFLREFTAAITPRLDVLTGLPRAGLWRHVRPRAWQRVLDAATASHTVVVVDVGFCLEAPETPETRSHHRNHVALDVLARARTVLAVSSAEPVGLARLVRGLDDIGELGIDTDLRIVVNRHDPATGWRAGDVEDTIATLTGRRAATILPFDHATASGALAAARTLREHDAESSLVRALDTLSQAL